MSSRSVAPVVTTKTFSSTTVIVLVIILFIFVGLGMFFYWKGNVISQNMENISKFREVEVALHNTTPSQQFVDIPTRTPGSRRVIVDPFSSQNIMVPVGRTIKLFSHLPSGERVNDAFKVAEEDVLGKTGGNGGPNAGQLIHNYVLTLSGVFPERVLSKDVQLVNKSQIPVMFVEKTRDGAKRWSSEIVPPMSYITKEFVAPGVLYDIVHPTQESQPITSLSTALKTAKITFDGEGAVTE